MYSTSRVASKVHSAVIFGLTSGDIFPEPHKTTFMESRRIYGNFLFFPFLPTSVLQNFNFQGFLKTHYFVVATFIGAPLTRSLNWLRTVSLLLCLLLLLSGEALPNSVPNKTAHTTHTTQAGLRFIGVFPLSLLMQCGDVHPNPGPVNFCDIAPILTEETSIRGKKPFLIPMAPATLTDYWDMYEHPIFWKRRS